MMPMDIEERLIRAAEIEEFGNRVGPARLKAMSLPYVHTQADMNGWGTRYGEKKSSNPWSKDACRLHPEDADRHQAERREFWNGRSRIPNAREVSDAEEAWGWYSIVKDDQNRAALAGWASCMAKIETTHKHFKDWCRQNHIATETGRRRKNRALQCILEELSRRALQNNENADFGVLLDDPEISDKSGTVKECEPVNGIRIWTDDTAFQPINVQYKRGYGLEVETEDGFDWARKRNEIRRQRDAKRREQAAQGI